MYTLTKAQIEAEQKLLKEGFQFNNWISAQTEDESQGCMVFTKKTAAWGRTEYREVDPEGNIN